MTSRDQLLRALDWQVEAGADEAVADATLDRYALSKAPSASRPAPQPATPPAAAATLPPDPAPPPQPRRPATPDVGRDEDARAAAAAATSLDELKAAVEAFEGCALKKTATTTVFADGVGGAPLMIVGEAPGREEDRAGLPFVGRAGQLLDRMLAAIGHSRAENAYITNMIFWRPPGNRDPDAGELAACLPFVERHIELAAPKVLVFTGNASAKTMLQTTTGITRLRGKWHDFRTSGMAEAGAPAIPAVATFHPAYLLRQPVQKRETWMDLLAIRERLEAADAA